MMMMTLTHYLRINCLLSMMSGPVEKSFELYSVIPYCPVCLFSQELHSIRRICLLLSEVDLG